jgi:hypothetical protein
MKKMMFVGFVMATALVACGGKNKKADTTMENKAGSGSAAPAGGATYGGAAAGSAAMPANPCAGKNPCGGGM